jgi:hypothetical protein
MSATLQPSQALVSGSSQHDRPAPFDPAGAQNLYAIWQEIFERAHAAGSGDRGAAPAAHDSSSERLSTEPSQQQREQSQRSVDAAAELSPAPTSSLAVAAAGSPHRSVSGTRLEPGASESVAAATLNGSQVPAKGQIPINDAPRAPAHHAALQASKPSTQLSLAESTAVSAESVLVFVRGALVTIVVRDATIAEEDALQGAFETARELTGQRAALQQLTLNGRTLYQQGETSASTAPASAAWVFAC